MDILFLIGGLIGGFLLRKFMFEKNFVSKDNFNELQQTAQKSTVNLKFTEKNLAEIKSENDNLKKDIESKFYELSDLSSEISALKTELTHQTGRATDLTQELNSVLEKIYSAETDINLQKQEIAQLKAGFDATFEKNKTMSVEIAEFKAEIAQKNEDSSKKSALISELSEKNKFLTEKLDTQKQEIEKLGTQFTDQFKVLANNILDEKTQKFTEQNAANLKTILDPLGINISEFKKKVEETYDRESKERFSLEAKIKELAELNLKISTEASNLTRALKGDSKKQGNWGEMILENILENSGLQKGREYVVQEFLRDENGKIIADSDTKRKFQPDVVINYPDNRKIIIDSKVSLVAYEQYANAETNELQQIGLQQHIKSLKTHIDGLSAKKYHEYSADTLDFVMLFVPIEPAYLDAIRTDQNLWDYAYKKRILLISPTNLIAALKLVQDLWQRDYQNRNAIEIAERGGKLYDKFVAFIERMNSIGEQLTRTQSTFNDAYKNLHTGNDNLVIQVEKLRKLGVKSTKTLPLNLSNQDE